MRYIKKTGLACLAACAACAVVLLSCVCHAATVPQIASAMGREMDRQVTKRFGQTEWPAREVSLCVTTPVSVNNLEISNALARQVQEELTRWFVQAGYDVHEIRKGAAVLFEPEQGELLLTRKQRLLGSARIRSAAIVSGTYTVTPKNVRFNIRMVSTGNQEVFAMSTMTVPVNRETAALVGESGKGAGAYGGIPIQPTVVTMLP